MANVLIYLTIPLGVGILIILFLKQLLSCYWKILNLIVIAKENNPCLKQFLYTHFNSNSRTVMDYSKNYIIYCVFFLMLLCSCQGEKFLLKHNLVKNNATINIVQNPNDSITVHYIGCSGFFIQKGDNIILIDPYFSYKVVCNPKLINRKISCSLSNTIDSIFIRAIGTKNDVSEIINALLISHSHVDHLGDVPYLFNCGHLNKKMKIIGSTTTGHYLRGNGVVDDSIVNNVEASASSWFSNGSWIYVNRNVRVLPIISEHGPHAKFFGHDFNFSSKRHEMHDIKRKLSIRYGTGQTLSYLIDYLNDDSTVNFRLYHSSASSNSPYGFPPASVLAEHRIDLEILCAASFNQVKNYPKEIIRYLNPRHIILSHWEDFIFSSISKIKEHPHTNYIYNYRKFFKRFNQVIHDINNNRNSDDTIAYTLPNVDTKILFRY